MAVRFVLGKLSLSMKHNELLLYIDISHLSLINDILRVNFNMTKWSHLGLSLRLHPNKIKEIEESQPTHHRRLLECLTLWLESQDSLPQFLVDALKDNNETSAAENIHKLSMLKH